jgi:hypothetical protein
MKPYIFFCELPGMEITEECDTFEQAFRAQHAYTELVLDQYSDFALMDLYMGIKERGVRIMAPQTMKRAQASGLMDQILTEAEINLPAEFPDSIFESIEDSELVPA